MLTASGHEMTASGCISSGPAHLPQLTPPLPPPARPPASRTVLHSWRPPCLPENPLHNDLARAARVSTQDAAPVLWQSTPPCLLVWQAPAYSSIQAARLLPHAAQHAKSCYEKRVMAATQALPGRSRPAQQACRPGVCLLLAACCIPTQADAARLAACALQSQKQDAASNFALTNGKVAVTGPWLGSERHGGGGGERRRAACREAGWRPEGHATHLKQADYVPAPSV